MKLNPSCCRTCQKYTRQVCEARDGKCRAFEEWFIAGKIWSRAVERLRRASRKEAAGHESVSRV